MDPDPWASLRNRRHGGGGRDGRGRHGDRRHTPKQSAGGVVDPGGFQLRYDSRQSDNDRPRPADSSDWSWSWLTPDFDDLLETMPEEEAFPWIETCRARWPVLALDAHLPASSGHTGSMANSGHPSHESDMAKRYQRNGRDAGVHGDISTMSFARREIAVAMEATTQGPLIFSKPPVQFYPLAAASASSSSASASLVPTGQESHVQHLDGAIPMSARNMRTRNFDYREPHAVLRPQDTDWSGSPPDHVETYPATSDEETCLWMDQFQSRMKTCQAAEPFKAQAPLQTVPATSAGHAQGDAEDNSSARLVVLNTFLEAKFDDDQKQMRRTKSDSSLAVAASRGALYDTEGWSSAAPSPTQQTSEAVAFDSNVDSGFVQSPSQSSGYCDGQENQGASLQSISSVPLRRAQGRAGRWRSMSWSSDGSLDASGARASRCNCTSGHCSCGAEDQQFHEMQDDDRPRRKRMPKKYRRQRLKVQMPGQSQSRDRDDHPDTRNAWSFQ